MPRLLYMPVIIPMMLVELGIVTSVVIYLYHKQQAKVDIDHLQTAMTGETRKKTFRGTIDEFFRGENFETCTRGFVRPNERRWVYVLLSTRTISMLFFVAAPCITLYTLDRGYDAFYFTVWNIDFICVYFILAVTTSVIDVLYGGKYGSEAGDNILENIESSRFSSKVAWPMDYERLSYAVQFLFEVGGASALFITVVAFSLLNPAFQFWNVAQHLLTSVAFLTEMALSRMTVRWEHILLNFAWATLYLLFAWPMVAENALDEWPYFFLELNTAGCFFWYNFLFIANALFFGIWWSLARLKVRYFGAYYGFNGLYPRDLSRVSNMELSSSSHQGLMNFGGNVEPFSAHNDPASSQGSESPMHSIKN